MGVRSSIAGLFVIVTASLALALNGLGATATAPPAAATPSPAPLPTVAVSPPASPASSPAGFVNFPSVLRALVPAAGASAAPAQTYAAFMRGADHQDGVIDLVRKDDQLFLDLRPKTSTRRTSSCPRSRAASAAKPLRVASSIRWS